MTYGYSVQQKNGSMFRIESKLSPREFVKTEMNLGAGLKTVYQLIENKWVKIFSDSEEK